MNQNQTFNLSRTYLSNTSIFIKINKMIKLIKLKMMTQIFEYSLHVLFFKVATQNKHTSLFLQLHTTHNLHIQFCGRVKTLLTADIDTFILTCSKFLTCCDLSYLCQILLSYMVNILVMTSLCFTAKTNMGQPVNNTVKAACSKLALADYGASADALDKRTERSASVFYSTRPD